jgi:hypothetical protein
MTKGGEVMGLTMRIVVAAVALAIAAPAFAQDQRTTPTERSQFAPEAPAAEVVAPGRRTVKAMVTEGYEIKAFSIVPRAIVVGGGSTADIDAVVFVMQKGETLANCYFGYTSLVDGSYYGGIESCLVLE